MPSTSDRRADALERDAELGLVQAGERVRAPSPRRPPTSERRRARRPGVRARSRSVAAASSPRPAGAAAPPRRRSSEARATPARRVRSRGARRAGSAGRPRPGRRQRRRGHAEGRRARERRGHQPLQPHRLAADQRVSTAAPGAEVDDQRARPRRRYEVAHVARVAHRPLTPQPLRAAPIGRARARAARPPSPTFHTRGSCRSCTS